MKEISIQDLRANLSATVAEAEAGSTIVVTRYKEPVAQLGPVRPSQVHRGCPSRRRAPRTRRSRGAPEAAT